MIRALDLHNRREALALLSVQMAAYLVEAKLLGSDEIPLLRDSYDKLQQCGEQFYGYFDGERLAGAISYKTKDTVLDIHRLMVHPDYFRQGIASALLRYVEKQLAAGAAATLTVATGARNSPAIQLYKRHGFIEIGEQLMPQGIVMTYFEKGLD